VGPHPLPAPADDERPGFAVLLWPIRLHRDLLSGPALARDNIALGGEDLAAVMSRRGRSDARAIACLERYERRFARAIASIINVVDPDVTCLAGACRTSRGV
jgi:fructokinase